jgi:hypothetical protein
VRSARAGSLADLKFKLRLGFIILSRLVLCDIYDNAISIKIFCHFFGVAGFDKSCGVLTPIFKNFFLTISKRRKKEPARLVSFFWKLNKKSDGFFVL